MRNVTLVDLGAGPIPAQTPPPARQAAWFPVVYQTAVVPPVTDTEVTPVADGVLLEWPAVESGGALVTYIIERGPTASGPWEEIARISETRYFYSDGSGQTWFFRITPSVRGKPGQGNVVVGTPELVARQQAFEAEVADRLQGDLQTAAAAGADATAKANAALSEAIARVDALAGEIGEIVNAPEWSATESYVAGWLVREGGNLYRAKVANTGMQPSASAAVWEYIGQFASAAEAAAAALQMATATASDLEAEAMKINSMQARMPGGSGQLETKARVDQVELALATGIEATAERVGVVEGAIPGLETKARVASVEQASVDRDHALGLRIDSTNSELRDKAESSTVIQMQSQVDQIGDAVSTNAGIILGVRAKTGGGGNLLPNSTFESDLSGWSIYASGDWDSTPARNYAGAGWTPVGGSQVGWGASGTPVGTFALASGVLSAEAGNSYILSGRVAAQRCSALLRFIYINASGGHIDPPESSLPAKASKWGGSDLANWDLLFAKGVAPAGTVGIQAFLIANDTTGAGPLAFFSRLMLEEVPTERTLPSEWSPSSAGTDLKYATATQTLAVDIDQVSTRVAAKVTNVTDVNGNISGTVSENDGVRSSFSILATVFRVISSISGMGMEWQDGYLRIWRGTAQLILGHSFGSGDIVMWYGPNLGSGSCTKANALFYLDTSGGGYFGGTVISGTISAGAQSSQIGDVTVETGSFNTNGRRRVVQYGMTYSAGYNIVGGTSGAIWATLTLQRKVGAGAWSSIDSLALSGVREVLGTDPELGSTMAMRMSGSSSFIDTSGGTQNMEYRVVLGNRGDWPPAAGVGAQRTYLNSTEY